MGRLFRRGKIWWLQYCFRGRVYRESSHSTVRAEAGKLLRRRQAEMGRGRLAGPDVERTTFEDLATMIAEDYQINGRKSADHLYVPLAHLRQFFGHTHAVDITPDRVTAYIRARLNDRERPAKPATVRNEVSALKRMFTLAARAGKVSHRPIFPSIEVRNTRSGFFEDDQLRRVIAHLPEHLKAYIEFANLTGWRAGEIRSLTWKQVDFAAGTIRLEPGTTKNDEGRVFPFGALPALADLIHKQRERTSSLERERGQIIPWVFHRNGAPIGRYQEWWRKACARAGVPGRIVHDLRRTAVRRLERAGVPRSVAMKLTGHKTESIYRRYAIVSESDLALGVGKLAALAGSTVAPPRLVVPISEVEAAVE